MLGSRRTTELLIGLILAAYPPSTASAQITGIAGIVRDASGAVIARRDRRSLQSGADREGPQRHHRRAGPVSDRRPAARPVHGHVLPCRLHDRQARGYRADRLVHGDRERGAPRSGPWKRQSPSRGPRRRWTCTTSSSRRCSATSCREDLPTARNVHNMAQLLPGTVMNSGTGRPSSQDVGGLSGDRGVVMIHGSRSQDYIISSMARC